MSLDYRKSLRVEGSAQNQNKAERESKVLHGYTSLRATLGDHAAFVDAAAVNTTIVPPVKLATRETTARADRHVSAGSVFAVYADAYQVVVVEGSRPCATMGAFMKFIGRAQGMSLKFLITCGVVTVTCIIAG